MMATLPYNIESEKKTISLLENERFCGDSLPGLLSRTCDYYNNLPDATKNALSEFGATLQSMKKEGGVTPMEL